MSALRRAVWNASRLIAHNGGPLSRALYQVASIYTRSYNNLNYNMETNGEFYLLDRLSKLNVRTVFDVGANKGDYVKACLSRFPEAHIHSFEIVPATFKKLSTNIASPRVSLNNFGLSNSQGELKINYNPYDDGSSSLIAGGSIHAGEWEKVKVEVITGDQYCSDKSVNSIDLLKVDVEGAENIVFDGFRKTFEKEHISAVQFEFGMVNIYAKFLLKDFWEFFTEYGFVIGPVLPKGVMFKDYNTRDENFQGCPNYFAAHKSKANLISAVKYR